MYINSTYGGRQNSRNTPQFGREVRQRGGPSVHFTSQCKFGEDLRRSRGAIGPTDPLALTLGPTRHAEPTGCPTAAGSHVPRADSTAGRARPEYPRGSETGDTNCDVTAAESHGRACIAGSL